MAGEKNRRLCVMCKEKPPYLERFDKCMTCARKYRDKMHKEFVAILTPEQLVIFQKYHKAVADFASIMILD